MNVVSTLLHTTLATHPSGALGQTLTVVGGAAMALAIWRRWVRRLTRILATTAVVVVTAIFFCHPDVFTNNNPIPPTPICCAAFHQ